jgi:Na+-driven multidrug efflux pump
MREKEKKQEHPLKSMAHLGWRPMLVALFTAIEGFVDTLFIIQIGLSAIEAVTISGNVLLIQLAIYATIGSVTNYNTSTAKNKTEAWKYLLQGLYLSCFICLALGAVAIVLASQLLTLYGVEATASGVLYLQMVGGTCMFPALFGVARDGLQGLKLQKSATYTGFAMIILHLFLDYVLIYLLHLGLMGAACASVLSSLIGTVWIISTFLCYAGTDLQWQIDWTIQKEILSQAFPKAVGSISNQVGMIFFFATLARTGTEALAANRIFNVVQGVFYVTWMRGVFSSITPVVGPMIEKNKQVAHYIRWALGTVLVGSIVSWAIQLMFAKAVVGFFTDDPAVSKMAVWLLLLYVWVNGLWAVYVCVGEVLGAHKKTQISSSIMFLSSVILVIGCWVASPTLVAISYAEAVQYLVLGTVSVAYLCGYFNHVGVSLFPIRATIERGLSLLKVHLRRLKGTHVEIQHIPDHTPAFCKNMATRRRSDVMPVFDALQACNAITYLESLKLAKGELPLEDSMNFAKDMLRDSLTKIAEERDLQEFLELETGAIWHQNSDSSVVVQRFLEAFVQHAKEKAETPKTKEALSWLVEEKIGRCLPYNKMYRWYRLLDIRPRRQWHEFTPVYSTGVNIQ